jgi:hypothetical protein
MSDAYTASCNPPRRAKRSKIDTSPNAILPLTPTSLKAKPPSPDMGHNVTDPDVPPNSPPVRKRGGRKSANMSRAAREALRKANHSLIEKARRTKINDALATLRTIVPFDYQRGDFADEEEGQVQSGSRGHSRKEDKEFKLEILERTVGYLQELKERVRVLEESSSCPDCTKGLKRKRQGSIVIGEYDSRNPLPSIASWLPYPYLDPSSVSVTPSTSPVSTSSLSQTFQHTSSRVGQRQLAPPPLTLPSPNLRPSCPRPTPITLEDESAATTLLHIASSPSLSPSNSFSDGSVMSSPRAERASSPQRTNAKPQTPGSLLGLKSHTN